MTGDKVEKEDMVFARLSDFEMAVKVRMLMRDQLDHEAVCCGARDRIMYLSQQNERQQSALEKINAIRNSIVGTQTVNWSAHVYPLVDALNTAGFEGQEYEEAKKEAATLIEQRDKAEKENTERKELLRDIYRVCGASSRASHREQTAIFQRLRKSLGVSV